MTLSISHPEPGARLGADQCPGTDQRGHGLTMTVIHDAGCCQEWETGQASTPARAESFRQAAARWGTAWPEKPQHPRLTQDYGPGKEPQSVRDAWDAHLQSQRETEPEPEAEARLTRLTGPGTAPGSCTRRPRPLRQNPGRRTANDQHRRRPAAHQSRP